MGGARQGGENEMERLVIRVGWGRTRWDKAGGQGKGGLIQGAYVEKLNIKKKKKVGGAR